MQAGEAFDRLPQITVPKLVLHGTGDRVFAPGTFIERRRDA